MNVLVDKGNNRLTTYLNKSAEIKTNHSNINSTLYKRSSPKGSKNK